MIQVTRCTATIHYTSVYACSVCGTRRSGDTVRREFEADDLAVLTMELMGLRLEPNSMPVGWASYAGERGATVYRCDQCMS